jgi:hypothetical protein
MTYKIKTRTQAQRYNSRLNRIFEQAREIEEENKKKGEEFGKIHQIVEDKAQEVYGSEFNVLTKKEQDEILLRVAQERRVKKGVYE